MNEIFLTLKSNGGRENVTKGEKSGNRDQRILVACGQSNTTPTRYKATPTRHPTEYYKCISTVQTDLLVEPSGACKRINVQASIDSGIVVEPPNYPLLPMLTRIYLSVDSTLLIAASQSGTSPLWRSHSAS